MDDHKFVVMHNPLRHARNNIIIDVGMWPIPVKTDLPKMEENDILF